MKSHADLQNTLRRIDGRGYKAYRDLRGTYQFPGFLLSFDSIQADPFASPSRVSVRLDRSVLGLPTEFSTTQTRRVATGDFVTRSFHKAITRVARGGRGTGKSGTIQIDRAGQEILERTSVLVTAEWLECRFTVGLPAAGRRVLARQAGEMLFDELPKIVEKGLLYREIDQNGLKTFVETAEDQEALRRQLDEKGLAAFIANGSILPRRSGVDDRPLSASSSQAVVRFQSPATLEVTLDRPNSDPVSGMGIPKGVTLIVGGGFHGKSTLLKAVERSVYNHVPGDGRENAVTLDSAVKIRAEDGRYVEKVDISPFINHLPFSRTTVDFSTENASGSTSQAANIIEALELGSRLLLIDEDTSATNFMIRDARMQALVPDQNEPITPLVDRVRQLFDRHGISTILVMGGSGDYFDVADRAIQMEEYVPVDVTLRMEEILETHPTERKSTQDDSFKVSTERCPLARSFDARRGRRDAKISTKGLTGLLFGTTEIDLSGLEQLVDVSQTRAIGQSILRFAEESAAKGLSLDVGLDRLMEALETQGLDYLSSFPVGNLARPRKFEIGAAINRMRSLKVG